MITIDNVDLLRYSMDILSGNETNDLSSLDIMELKSFVEELISLYLNNETDNDSDIEYDNHYCLVCGKKTPTKIIYTGDDCVYECQECRNLEVL